VAANFRRCARRKFGVSDALDACAIAAKTMAAVSFIICADVNWTEQTVGDVKKRF
jgi:hypothetical protein